MCVILVCPEKVRPDFDILKACWDSNPHGAGVAWRDKGEVHWLKTNSVHEVAQVVKEKNGELILHFRIASVGGVCDELRHPFPVSKRAGLATSGKARAVLFQNGTWGRWREALEHAQREGHSLPQGKMSDARAAAFLCSIYGHDFLRKCAPSRWVFFGAYSTSVFGDWDNIGGIRFSNTYWRSYLPKQQNRHEHELELDDECHECEPAGIPGATPQHKTKLDRELELWDMSATKSYWDIVYGKGRGKK